MLRHSRKKIIQSPWSYIFTKTNVEHGIEDDVASACGARIY